MFPILVLFALFTLLSACSNQPLPHQSNTESRVVGGDRDVKGCIRSAGYSWCEYTAQCERPWELAAEQGFALENEGFINYCAEAD
ncbi:hypothetical protein [Zhongshania aquimaris]|uniref:Serine protease n=1 Tax=Zhongshania aquimaris TaxID=2857107 RepID=A0ABS6VTL8_9GAMM|nr:hypothetical protein [Zhongshania aquimaris]MBW2941662.1 hypothetical protein [Zhongshania aquimaris]